MIRKCTPDDMEWILEVAKKTFPDFREQGVRDLFPSLMAHKDSLVIRGDHGWILAFIENIPWYNHISTYVDLVALDKTRKSISEMMRILSHVKKLGEERGATKMRLASLDVVGDLGCFVKRLNGREIGKLWEI